MTYEHMVNELEGFRNLILGPRSPVEGVNSRVGDISMKPTIVRF